MAKWTDVVEDFLSGVNITLRERAVSYGNPRNTLAMVAMRWSDIFERPVTPQMVVLALIDLKLARLAHCPDHLDSAVDVAGYAALLALVQEAEDDE